MIALIPARGGSKGLPGKNTKLLHGKPLIAYSIETALKSESVSRVIVSTDDEKIKSVALEFGAEVPFLRPSELARDSSNAIDSYIFTIKKLNEEYDYNINEFIVLLPTSPLRTSEDIDNAVRLFYEKKADSVISYTEEAHPINWHKYINNDLSFEGLFELKMKNRQDYKTTYYPNGAIYVFKKDLIFRQLYYSQKSFAYIMPRNRSVDIDTIEDFEYVEYLLTKNK